MMIVATSNYAKDSYCEKIAVRYVHPFIAKIYREGMNSCLDPDGETYYQIKPDDYKPWRGMYDINGDEYPHND